MSFYPQVFSVFYILFNQYVSTFLYVVDKPVYPHHFITPQKTLSIDLSGLWKTQAPGGL